MPTTKGKTDPRDAVDTVEQAQNGESQPAQRFVGCRGLALEVDDHGR